MLVGNGAAYLAQVKKVLTYDNLKEMKANGLTGTISDADMRALEASAASLSPTMSKDAIKEELNRLMLKL